jgi:hypothetical protein
MQRSSVLGVSVKALIIAIVFIVVGASAFMLLDHKHTDTVKAQNTLLSSYCVGQSYTTGSSGHCVDDIQTLVNYMEHSGLTECPFDGGATLTVNSSYDGDTTTQVKSVQGWSECYAKQEGFTSNVKQTGTVDKVTWGLLCTYGYTDPLHTTASGASEAIAAGKDAGCGELHA